MNLAPILLALGPWNAPPEPPTGLSARVGPGPYHVGQAIEVRVESAEGALAAGIEPPTLAGAEVRGPGPGPGGAVARFVLIPRRAGPLDLPPFRLKVGEKKVASRPIRLTVASVPAPGRTPAFLGGVGAFEVRAEAGPATVRAGQTLEYRLTISGPAAWGSLRAPDLAAWAALAARIRVEPLPPGEVEGEPPTRTFRYRLRPTVGGRFVLPPVAVAAFDPASRGFATRYSPGVPIVVEEPPKLDRSRIDYGDEERPAGTPGPLVGYRGFAILAPILAVLVLFARRARARRPVDPTQVAAELAAGLDASGSGSGPEAAGRATAAVASFLERVGGRPAGALTPPEAREHVGRLAADPGLTGRAGRLIEACDRARFGGPTESEGGDLTGEAREVLIEVGRAMKRREGAAEGGGRTGKIRG